MAAEQFIGHSIAKLNQRLSDGLLHEFPIGCNPGTAPIHSEVPGTISNLSSPRSQARIIHHLLHIAKPIRPIAEPVTRDGADIVILRLLVACPGTTEQVLKFSALSAAATFTTTLPTTRTKSTLIGLAILRFAAAAVTSTAAALAGLLATWLLPAWLLPTRLSARLLSTGLLSPRLASRLLASTLFISGLLAAGLLTIRLLTTLSLLITGFLAWLLAPRLLPASRSPAALLAGIRQLGILLATSSTLITTSGPTGLSRLLTTTRLFTRLLARLSLLVTRLLAITLLGTIGARGWLPATTAGLGQLAGTRTRCGRLVPGNLAIKLTGKPIELFASPSERFGLPTQNGFRRLFNSISKLRDSTACVALRLTGLIDKSAIQQLPRHIQSLIRLSLSRLANGLVKSP